jgi:hypothetical protein
MLIRIAQDIPAACPCTSHRPLSFNPYPHPYSFSYQDWLMTSDKVQHVLDLVRIDGERIANSNGGTGSRSNDSCDALVNALVMRSDLFVDAK